MVELMELAGDPDHKSDAMALGSAFRAASDDDTRRIMNLMSNNSEGGGLESLRYHIVPASWFSRAWPVLMAKSYGDILVEWKQNIGMIHNEELLDIEREVSASDDDDNDKDNECDNDAAHLYHKKRFELLHKRMSRNRERCNMRKGLVHQKDFFFLGPSAWMLVKTKFGFDGYELPRSVVALQNSENTLAIQLHPEECEGNKSQTIEIPASGRFAYEKVIVDDGETSTRDIVPQNESPTGEESAADEKAEGRIILLPPSTSSRIPNGTNGGDDMDIDSRMSYKISPSPSLAVSGRKRLTSGLGNLGNTCFMSSTLQCLAHTDPIRRYFVSGEYERDLNRDNPLGTGGELATQFASLISEMWGVSSKRRNVLGTNQSRYSNSAVFPREFKHCLGRHAEQFLGYDQHDSQEFATYLLDALHEDTNRVTKKPYIEKPEQGEDEPDDVAANKAWGLHLQREDSKVLENFMGQVKSRLECCEEECNRVSTTFDPFMYLSVPIPGATERTVKVTFVPLDPTQKKKNLWLKMSKVSTVKKLMAKMNEELINLGVLETPIPDHDLCAADIWSHEVFSWHTPDTDLDKIREADTTYIYQLRPLSEIQAAGQESGDADDAEPDFGESRVKHKRIKLDLNTTMKLNRQDGWMRELEDYVHQPTMLYSLFNPNRGTVDEKVKFHRKLDTFIGFCYSELDEEESSGPKTTQENGENGEDEEKDDEKDDEKNSEAAVPPDEQTIQGLVDRSDVSKTFTNVKSKRDVAILEFCANKFRQFIIKLARDKKAKYKDGVTIQIVMKRHVSGQGPMFGSPTVIRVPSNMSVYEFRLEVASRLAPFLRPEGGGNQPTQDLGAGEPSAEAAEKQPLIESDPFGSPESFILRQLALTYDRKSTYSGRSSGVGSKKLGMIGKYNDSFQPGPRKVTLAVATDEAEKALVSDMVGPLGSVAVDWPPDICDRVFNIEEYEMSDDMNPDALVSKKEKTVTTVQDCIKKYCQMEQLEETEMWYCNSCKKHVRAWKQFHLYRTPPILIVHLKRFQYSASTHRRDKITTFIKFPLKGLDLSDMALHFEEDQRPIYDLYAVSNHYGGLGGGHYTAYTLSDDQTWCHYDDSRVTHNIDPEEVVSEAAYVLYYRRRDVQVNQDFTPPPIVLTTTTKSYEQEQQANVSISDNDHDENHDGNKIVNAVPNNIEDVNHDHGNGNGVGQIIISGNGYYNDAIIVGAGTSSNVVVDDDDDDNMAVDGGDGASRISSTGTISSHIGSVGDDNIDDNDDIDNDQQQATSLPTNGNGNGDDAVSFEPTSVEEFPLQ